MTKEPWRMVKNRSWDRYKKIITDFLDWDAGRQTITWAKNVNQLLSHAEDSIPKYYNIQIEALCYYNAFRNWPINKATITGELDDENLSILISKSYIEQIGYLTPEGYWDFNWEQDRFVINGIVYKPSGDTQTAQAKDEALVFMVILKRDREIEKVELLGGGKAKFRRTSKGLLIDLPKDKTPNPISLVLKITNR